MKISEKNNKILVIKFSTQKEMASTLIRFQEHYESPHFKSKIFSLAKFKKWYKKQNNNKFTYYTDWIGFNFPGHILLPFIVGYFNPLSKNEKLFLEKLSKYNITDYCIIGIYNGHTINHEMAHALFHQNYKYRNRVLNIVSKLTRKEKVEMKAILKKDGYHDNVMIDEIHAYLLPNDDKFNSIMTNNMEKVRNKLKLNLERNRW